MVGRTGGHRKCHCVSTSSERNTSLKPRLVLLEAGPDVVSHYLDEAVFQHHGCEGSNPLLLLRLPRFMSFH